MSSPAVVGAGPVFVTLAYLAFAAAGLALIRSDLREHRLPNVVVLPATAVVALLLVTASAVSGSTEEVVRATIGGLALGVFYLLLWRMGRRDGSSGMGGGDVKLAVLIGFFCGWHGWTALAVGAVAAFVVAGVSATALIAVGRADRETRIAFGPYMLIGACIGPVLG